MGHRGIRPTIFMICGPACALGVLLLWPAGAAAQQQRDGREASVDSVAAVSPVSARGALIRSLVLPGWGQAYVGAPGRGAVYFALEAGSVWMTYTTLRQLGEARETQRWLRETGELAEGDRLAVVDAREDQLEDWITLSVFVLLFGAADAYVTAQLADFGEHVGVGPATGGGVRLQARLPVGARR